MARIKVFLDGQLSSQHELNASQDFVAGRGESCDCVLRPERGISRQHFKIFQSELGWEIESLSRFGELYVGGEKIERTLLHSGQMFSVPPYEFVFEEGSAKSEVSVPSIAAPEVVRSTTNGSNGGMSDERTLVGAMPSTAILRLIDHRGHLVQTFGLDGFNWVAGREIGCSIFIDNSKISRKQFEIQKTEETYFVRDLGGINGTLVNGRLVPNDQWTQLQSSDVITVADWSLVFEIRDSEFEHRLAQIDPAFRSPVAFTGGGQQGGYNMPTPYADPMNLPAMYLPQSPGGGGVAGGGPTGGMTLFGAHISWLNPIRLALIVIIGFGGLYYVVEGDGSEEAKTQAKVQSPFDKLTIEKQQIVKQTYNLANEYYMTGRFQQARQKLEELHAILPAYEDSQQLSEYVNRAIDTQVDIEKLKAQEEDEKKLRALVGEILGRCKAMVEKEIKTITMARLETCVSEVLMHDPNNAEIDVLRQNVDRLEQDRAIVAAQSAEYQKKVKALEALYKKARQTELQKKPLTAIRDYSRVVAAPLPDPNNRKVRAQRKIASIEKSIRIRQGALIKAAEGEYAKGNRKDAIQMLKKPIRVNPGNPKVEDRIVEIVAELRKDMQPIYHEGILEESVGNVDPARQRFMKILETSVPGEEYYDKAKMKMRKYGL